MKIVIYTSINTNYRIFNLGHKGNPQLPSKTQTIMWFNGLKNKYKNNKVKVTLKTMIIIINITGLLYETNGRQKVMYEKLRATEGIFQFLDITFEVILTVTIIIDQECLIDNFEFFKQVTQLLKKFGSGDSLDTYSKVVIFFMHFLAFIAGSMILYCLNQINVVKYIVTTFVGIVVFNTLVSAFYGFTQKIKRSLKSLNDNFLNESEMLTVSLIKINLNQNTSQSCKGFTITYDQICEVLDEVNERFKTSLTMTVACITVSLLWTVSMMIKYGFQVNTEEVFGLSKWLPITAFFLHGCSMFVCFNFCKLYILSTTTIL